MELAVRADFFLNIWFLRETKIYLREFQLVTVFISRLLENRLTSLSHSQPYTVNEYI